MSEDRSVPSELQKKLGSKGAVDACPMCRNETWGLLRDFAGRDRFAVSPNLGPLYAHGLVCLNCGFVRWHVADVLNAGLRDADATGDTE
jgi:hypothetical protein